MCHHERIEVQLDVDALNNLCPFFDENIHPSIVYVREYGQVEVIVPARALRIEGKDVTLNVLLKSLHPTSEDVQRIRRFENLFGGLSTAYDFVDLVQKDFCAPPVAPLQGSLERLSDTSPTVSRHRIHPPNRF